MSRDLQVFVSSVQKELEDERLIIQNLVNTDTFLSAHCQTVLYEFEPALPTKALEGCIESLDSCQVYLLIVGVQYGTKIGEMSITHAEYRHAKEKGLPVLVFIRGERSLKREERAALVRRMGEGFGIVPTSDEDQIAEHAIEATSAFESKSLDRIRWRDLDMSVARRLVASAKGREPVDLTDDELLTEVAMRGLVWRDVSSGEHFATAAGIVLLAKDPSVVFPQCRILADAFRSIEPDGEPRDRQTMSSASLFQRRGFL